LAPDHRPLVGAETALELFNGKSIIGRLNVDWHCANWRRAELMFTDTVAQY